MESVRHLRLPLTEHDARSLSLGSMVTVSGMIFTGRSRFHIRAVEENILPPIDFGAVNCFFHVGPVMRKTAGGYEVVSIEPTSSIRFERYGGEVVRKLRLRTLIGKTTMGPDTAAALRDIGGVFLSKVGICGNQLAPQVIKVHGVHFLEELGKTEATWVFEVEKFGPFFVAIDSQGESYFDNIDAEVNSHMEDIYRELGIPAGFSYTSVDSSDSRSRGCV